MKGDLERDLEMQTDDWLTQVTLLTDPSGQDLNQVLPFSAELAELCLRSCGTLLTVGLLLFQITTQLASAGSLEVAYLDHLSVQEYVIQCQAKHWLD